MHLSVQEVQNIEVKKARTEDKTDLHVAKRPLLSELNIQMSMLLSLEKYSIIMASSD